MEAAEFDKFADEYLALHARNLALSGEDPDFFAHAKIAEIRRRWTAARWPEPRRILDFGSGIGASLPHLARAFPGAALTALDVSERSLAISAARHGAVAERVLWSGEGQLPLPQGAFDLVFTACVFHHIPADRHEAIFALLRAALASPGETDRGGVQANGRKVHGGGALAVFEHNPANPVTRYIVATCPFDENAVLIAPRTLTGRLRRAGFANVAVRFTGFFPRALAGLRPLEPALAWAPIGAQYYALARS